MSVGSVAVQLKYGLYVGHLSKLAFHFMFKVVRLVVVVSSVRLACNVLQLGEVAEIEAQMFSFAQKFNRRTAVEFSTIPAILPNCLLPAVLVIFTAETHGRHTAKVKTHIPLPFVQNVRPLYFLRNVLHCNLHTRKSDFVSRFHFAF